MSFDSGMRQSYGGTALSEEKRQFKRLSLERPAEVRVPSASGLPNTYAGRVAEISVSGLRVVLTRQVPGLGRSGTAVSISIERARPSAPLQITGFVLRSILDADGTQQLIIQYNRPWYDAVAAIGAHHKVVVEVLL